MRWTSSLKKRSSSLKERSSSPKELCSTMRSQSQTLNFSGFRVWDPQPYTLKLSWRFLACQEEAEYPQLKRVEKRQASSGVTLCAQSAEVQVYHRDP